jgi:nicotinamidase/pyrazinamidase
MHVDPRTDALLIIDVQRDFLPGGSLAVGGGDRVVAPIARVAPRFSTVVATQDFHPRGHVSFASAHPGRRPFETIAVHGEPQTLWPDHCVAGTDGAALDRALPDGAISLVLRKGARAGVDSYSAFRENVGEDGSRATTGLGAWLASRGIRRVLVCGLARDFCVRATALDALAEGFEAVVLDDLTRSVDPTRDPALDDEFAARGVARARSGDLEFESGP